MQVLHPLLELLVHVKHPIEQGSHVLVVAFATNAPVQVAEQVLDEAIKNVVELQDVQLVRVLEHVTQGSVQITQVFIFNR